MNEDARESAEYLAGQVVIYKATVTLLVTRFIRSRSAEVQIAFRREVEQKIKELLPQALAPHIPPGRIGDGMQDALSEILGEFLTPQLTLKKCRRLLP